MGSMLLYVLLLTGSSVVVWRAIGVVDHMSRCTCRRVRWSWLALAVAALAVVMTMLVGEDLALALGGFFGALGWVFATDRRWDSRGPSRHRKTSITRA